MANEIMANEIIAKYLIRANISKYEPFQIIFKN